MKHLLNCLLLVSPWMLAGQVQLGIVPQGPPVSRQGWNLSNWSVQLHAPASGEIVVLTTEVMAPDGRLLYRHTSAPFALTGATVPAGAGTAEAVFSDPDMDSWVQSTGCLPRGNYLIRCSLHHAATRTLLTSKEMRWRASGQCLPPLLLIQPANRQPLAQTRPGFSWTVPFSGPTNQGVSYRIQVYAMETEQSPEQAAGLNPPLFEAATPVGQFAFPPYARDLEQGRKYAWYVTASWNGYIVARSEVWSFHYQPAKDAAPTRSPAPTGRTVFFRPGSPTAPPRYRLATDILPFFVVQQQPGARFRMKITDTWGNLLTDRMLDTELGHNYLAFSLSDLGLEDFPAQTTYRLDLLLDDRPHQTFLFITEPQTSHRP